MDQERFRTTLLEERTRIEGAIEYLHQETPGTLEDETEEILGGVDNHLGDAANGTLDREIDYSLEANSGQVLVQIDAALKRLEEGTYGTCSKCGGPIPEERLEAVPWAAYDVECQRRLEAG
jgi:RNA polymerase-binding transcription factor